MYALGVSQICFGPSRYAFFSGSRIYKSPTTMVREAKLVALGFALCLIFDFALCLKERRKLKDIQQEKEEHVQ